MIEDILSFLMHVDESKGPNTFFRNGVSFYVNLLMSSPGSFQGGRASEQPIQTFKYHS